MRRKSYAVSFCALMAALGTALMLSLSLLGVATYCAPLLAALCLIPVMAEFDLSHGWMVWAVTAFLSLLTAADREAAFFYLFLGCYPLLRSYIHRCGKKGLRLALKLGYFALAIAAMYALLCFVFRLDAVLEDFRSVSLWINAVFYLLMVVVMLLFDRCLDVAALFYFRRLRPLIVRKK